MKPKDFERRLSSLIAEAILLGVPSGSICAALKAHHDAVQRATLKAVAEANAKQIADNIVKP